MDVRDRRLGSSYRTPRSGDGSAEPLPRLSLRRLLTLCGVVLVAAGTGGSLLCPFRVGWSRAARLVALEDRLDSLTKEKQELGEGHRYRGTNGGTALEAYRQFEYGEPGGRVIELSPKQAAPSPSHRVSLSERAEAAEKRAQLAVYRNWRILVRYLLDRRLPPPESNA
jgi:hypothetical protein